MEWTWNGRNGMETRKDGWMEWSEAHLRALIQIRCRSLGQPKTVGIIAVDLYGHPATTRGLNTLLQTSTAQWLLEDAAEAPLPPHGRKVAGSSGIASTFSFYATRYRTSGEGGAIGARTPTWRPHASR